MGGSMLEKNIILRVVGAWEKGGRLGGRTEEQHIDKSIKISLNQTLVSQNERER